MSSSIQERLKKLEYQYRCLCANPSGGVGPEGPQGPQGKQGPPGYGIDLQGELANPSLLPQPSTQGFAYLIDGDFWVYDSLGTWINAGPIQGPEGPEGPQGNQGNPGDPGTQGNPGQGFTYQGNWNNNTAYYPYDVVTYLGSTYITPNSNVSSVPVYNNSNPDWYLFTSIGQQGPPGNSGSGGGSSCPNHFKLAGVSGTFQSNSSNSPFINGMYCSNSDLGWSFGQYDTVGDSDGYGNLIYVKPSHINGGIPLTIDLNVGDTVKISGLIYLDKSPGIAKPTNVKYYVTVSTFSCPNIGIDDSPTPVTTVIPVTTYSLENGEYVCFSESVILPSILPANETFFVVGLGFGTDSLTSYYYTSKFSYSLDVTQSCIGVGNNYLIRNCCDPAYTEIIIDNGVELGKSFVDFDGNCWTVESEVTNAVTSPKGTRAVSTEYFNCETCISNNPCPQNLVIESCCSEIPQVFSAALPAVNVGDTFVDINGFCWSAIDTTALPITNVIEVDIVYTATSCQDETCTNTNTCPTPIELVSCCGNLNGFTTLELLQAVLPTFESGNIFVDTFGMCWNTKDSEYAFPNLTFIVPVIDYGYNNCAPCVGVNECPTNFYYTIQNCCTEEIEVVLINALYNASQVLTLTLNTAFGCYEVLSWSDTGTPTAILLNVGGVHSNCVTCEEYIRAQYENYYCSGVDQYCETYEVDSIIGLVGSISGYTCDGEFILDYQVSPGNTICMAFVIVQDNMKISSDCCEFDVFNPSLVNAIPIIYKTCNGGFEIETQLPANTLLSSVTGNCVRCARTYIPGQEFEYRTCN